MSSAAAAEKYRAPRTASEKDASATFRYIEEIIHPSHSPRGLLQYQQLFAALSDVIGLTEVRPIYSAERWARLRVA